MLAGAHPHQSGELARPDLSVADLPGAGPGCLHDGLDDVLDGVGGNDHLDLGLGQEVLGVLPAAVDLLASSLVAVPENFGDRQPADAFVGECGGDGVEPGAFDDCGDEFQHGHSP